MCVVGNVSLLPQVQSVVKGNVVPIVDDDSQRDYRKIPPSWHVYSYPRSNISRFDPAKIDDLGLLGESPSSLSA